MFADLVVLGFVVIAILVVAGLMAGERRRDEGGEE